MNYLIAHQVNHFPYLVTTARKKSIKHKLITVVSGLVSVRLGKHEYLFQKGQSIWLPFDCLAALTYFPNSQTVEVEVSTRSTQPYSFQAGLVTPSSLLTALLDTLKQSAFDATSAEQKAWLTVVNLELGKLAPTLSADLPTLDSANQKQAPALADIDDAELKMVLKVREAFKARSSGMKVSRIIEDVFAGNAELAKQLCLSIANQKL